MIARYGPSCAAADTPAADALELLASWAATREEAAEPADSVR